MKQTEENKMDYYYEFSGVKHALPLSLCVNSFANTHYHKHKHIEFVYVLSGDYSLITEDGELFMGLHDMAAVASDEIHMLKNQNEEKGVLLIIQIEIDKIPDQLFFTTHRNQVIRTHIIRDKDRKSRIQKLLSSIVLDLIEAKVPDTATAYMNILSFLGQLTGEHKQVHQKSATNSDLMKAIEMAKFIDENLTEDISLDDLASEMHFSSTYTSKFFKKCMDISFSKYLARTRIRASIPDLVAGELTISDIALKYGMPNTKAYTSYFKEFYDVTPNAYRMRFASQSETSDYDRENMYMALNDNAKKLLLHLLDENLNYVVGVCSKSSDMAKLVLDSLYIKNIDRCLSSSNFQTVDVLMEMFQFPKIVLDFKGYPTTKLKDLNFIYNLVEFFTHMQKHRCELVVNLDQDYENAETNEVYNELKEILSNFENVCFLNTTIDAENVGNMNCLDWYVEKLVQCDKINCSVFHNDNSINLVDANNYKSEYFFILSMLTKMNGDILLYDKGSLVIRTKNTVIILLINDNIVSEYNNRNINICLDNMVGNYIMTSHFVDDVQFYNEEESFEPDPISRTISNKNKLYIRKKGKFGHSTETIKAFGEYQFKTSIKKNRLMTVTFTKI